MDDSACNFCGASARSRDMLLVREESEAAICDRCVQHLAHMVAEHYAMEVLMGTDETRH